VSFARCNALLDRKDFLRVSGALVVGFRLATTSAAAQGMPSATQLDSWLSIGADGHVTIYIGKVELGTGIETAFAQLAADELDVPLEKIRVVMGITGVTPDQGVTSGSQSIQAGSIPLRHACATARLALASGALIPGRITQLSVDPSVPLKTSDFHVVGKPVRRVDVPAKAYGRFDYVQNVRVAGMLHARVVRPPRVGASLVAVDQNSIHAIPSARIVRKGDFLAVAAPREWDAVRAASALKATWRGGSLPEEKTLYDVVRATPASPKVVAQSGDVDAAQTASSTKLAATYLWPFQTHGSIGPSCAVADVRNGKAQIWSGTQGVYPMRDAIAEMLGMPRDAIRVTYVEASGCYGHNGADDAAADAALISQAIGKPVRVQWSRADEHGWDPKGPAMVVDLRGAVASGKITAWQSDVYTPTHSERPSGMAGNLLAARLIGIGAAVNPNVGGDRNAAIDYTIPAQRVTVHWLESATLRQSALRGLGGTQNTFANESFVDELARAAGIDPLEFRLAHLQDPRGRDVLSAVATLAKWQPGTKGRGLAYARYEGHGAYVAAVVDLDVERSSGNVRLRNVFVAHDCGLIVNPDGLRNQIEGNVIQSASRTLKEEVKWAGGTVTTLDWQTYPIARFSEIPDVAITLIDRPNENPLGAGEATTVVIAPAIANAIFSATGVRLRQVPFTPERVKAALA
jgi:nicotinate dehydrogenase subunit B